MYKMYEILGVSKGKKKYKFGGAQTDMMLSLLTSRGEKLMRMEYVSNSDFLLVSGDVIVKCDFF